MTQQTALLQFATLLSRNANTPVPEDVRQAIRLHVIDTVGAWIAGAGANDGRKIIVVRRRSPPLARDDVALHVGVARSSEIDDINIASMITPGSIVVPTALSVATAWKIDPARIPAAIINGYETMVRFGRMIDGPSVLYRGIWPTYLACPLGVAATAGSLINLNGERMAHALALALTLASPGVGRQSAPTNTRWFAIENGVRNGLFSSRMGEADFTSDIGVFDNGFLSEIYNIKPNLDALTAGFGDSSSLTGTSFKPWCAARQTMAATQAFVEMLREVQVTDIREVEAFVLPPHVRMIDHGVAPGDRFSHLTSLPYQMAVGALAPETAYAIDGAQGDLPTEVPALMGKIKVQADDGLLAQYPKVWAARVVVTTASGRYERHVTNVPGDPERPFDEAAVAAKFRRIVTPVVGAAAAEEFLAMAQSASEQGATPLMPRIQQLYDSILPGQK